MREKGKKKRERGFCLLLLLLAASRKKKLTVRGPRGLGLVELLVEGPVRSQALGRAVVGGAAVAAAAPQADDTLLLLFFFRGSHFEGQLAPVPGTFMPSFSTKANIDVNASFGRRQSGPKTLGSRPNRKGKVLVGTCHVDEENKRRKNDDGNFLLSSSPSAPPSGPPPAPPRTPSLSRACPGGGRRPRPGARWRLSGFPSPGRAAARKAEEEVERVSSPFTVRRFPASPSPAELPRRRRQRRIRRARVPGWCWAPRGAACSRL